MSKCAHDLEYCSSPQDFKKRYGRWQVRCNKCDYKSYLVQDNPTKSFTATFYETELELAPLKDEHVIIYD